jgi:DNA helicase IV
MSLVKIKEYPDFKKDLYSKGVINTNKKDYESYKKRKEILMNREKEIDQIRDTVKEINILKQELYEIKKLILEVLKK